MSRSSEIFKFVKSQVAKLKNYITTDIKAYVVKDYVANKYKEPAQMLAYEDAYQIVDAISNGDFLECNGQIMLRNDKRNKMLEMLKQRLFIEADKSNLDRDEIITERALCADKCVLF